MQLSWIDPEVLRHLAANLQDPEPPKPADQPKADMYELAFERALEANLMNRPPDAEEEHPEAEEIESPAPPPPAAEDPHVARIRQQLELIRAKALQAGLLQPEPASPQRPQPPEHPSAPPAVNDEKAPPPEAPAPVPPAPESVPPFSLQGNLRNRLEQFALWGSAETSAEELLLVDDHGDVLWGERSDLAFTALVALNSAFRSSTGGMPPTVVRQRMTSGLELTVLPCGTRHGTVTLALLSANPVPDEKVELLRRAVVQGVEGPSM